MAAFWRSVRAVHLLLLTSMTVPFAFMALGPFVMWLLAAGAFAFAATMPPLRRAARWGGSTLGVLALVTVVASGFTLARTGVGVAAVAWDTFAVTAGVAAPWLAAAVFAALTEEGKARGVSKAAAGILVAWLAYFALLLLEEAGIVPGGAWSSVGDAHIAIAVVGMALVMGVSLTRLLRRPRPAAEISV